MAERPTLLTRADVVRSAPTSQVDTRVMSEALGGIQDKVQQTYLTRRVAERRQEANDKFKLALEAAGGDITKTELPKANVRMLNFTAAQAFNEEIRNLTTIKLFGLAQRHSEILAEEAKHQGEDKKTLDPDYYSKGMGGYLTSQLNELSKDAAFRDVIPQYQKAVLSLYEAEHTKLTEKKVELIHSEHLQALDSVMYEVSNAVYDRLRGPIKPSKGQTFSQAVAVRANDVVEAQKYIKQLLWANYGELKSDEDLEKLYQEMHDQLTSNFFMSLQDEWAVFNNPAAYKETAKYLRTGELFYYNKNIPQLPDDGGPDWYDAAEKYVTHLTDQGRLPVFTDSANPVLTAGDIDPLAQGRVDPANVVVSTVFFTDDKGRKYNVKTIQSRELRAWRDQFKGTPYERRANEGYNYALLTSALYAVAMGNESEFNDAYELLTDSNLTNPAGQLGVSNEQKLKLSKLARDVKAARDKALNSGNPIDVNEVLGKHKVADLSQAMQVSQEDPKNVDRARTALATKGVPQSVIQTMDPRILSQVGAVYSITQQQRTNAAFAQAGRQDQGPIAMFTSSQISNAVASWNDLMKSTEGQKKVLDEIAVFNAVASLHGVDPTDMWAHFERQQLASGDGAFRDETAVIRLIGLAPNQAAASDLMQAFNGPISTQAQDSFRKQKTEQSYTPYTNDHFRAIHVTTGGNANEVATVVRDRLAMSMYDADKATPADQKSMDTYTTAANKVMDSYAQGLAAEDAGNGQWFLTPHILGDNGQRIAWPRATVDTVKKIVLSLEATPGASKSFLSSVLGQRATSSVRPDLGTVKLDVPDGKGGTISKPFAEVRLVQEQPGTQPANVRLPKGALKQLNDPLIQKELGIEGAVVKDVGGQLAIYLPLDPIVYSKVYEEIQFPLATVSQNQPVSSTALPPEGGGIATSVTQVK